MNKNLNIINKIEKKAGASLTPLRRAVLEIIVTAPTPLGAYDILRTLRKSKPKAEPPTVYRALDYLTKNNFVHRIESTNAYFCCLHTETKPQSHCAQLLICTQCKGCEEVINSEITTLLQRFATSHAFKANAQPIEIYGICKQCARL